MKKLIIFATIALVLSIAVNIFALVVISKTNDNLRGYTAGYWDSAEGYYVDGTQIINGSGVLVGAVSGTTGAFSSTLIITGATTLSSTLAVTGESNLDTLVYGGDETTISAATTTITAAQICDSSIINYDMGLENIIGETATIYITTSTEIIADCLPTIGDTKEFLFHNTATSTNALTIAAYAGQEAVGSSPWGYLQILASGATGGNVIVGENEFARIKITNLTGTTSTVEIIDLVNGD